MTRSHGASPVPERALDALLAEVERLMRSSDPGGARDDARLVEAMETLEEAVGDGRPRSRRLARRLEDVRARYALRSRQIPDDALDGLYESVRARAAEAERGDFAWRRAGMSNAFLDAPHALARWRRLAVAACALIAVGVGLVATRQVEVVEPGAGSTEAPPQTAHDPRDELLPRWKPARAEAVGWQPWVRSAGAQPARSRPLPRLFTFTVRPRRDWDAGHLLDVIPAKDTSRADDLEKN